MASQVPPRQVPGVVDQGQDDHPPAALPQPSDLKGNLMSIMVHEPGQFDTPPEDGSEEINTDSPTEPQQPNIPDDYWESRCCT